MRLPAISDYIRTMENPHGVFRTLGDVAVERDVYNQVELRAGNSAAVFTYKADGARRLLKCYVRPNPRLREIYGYIERNHPPLLADVRLLADELYVHTLSGQEGWTDVVEGEWTDGETLDAVIVRASKNGDARRLGALSEAFDTLCRELLAQEWAHGDLKPENIVAGDDGAMTLIDCDAMWLPQFVGERASETGTPAYRHPLRGAGNFDKRIDDYPAMLVSVSLHAIALDPSLFARYTTTDNMIFSPVELVAGTSPAFGEVAELFVRHGLARELRMLEACRRPEPDAVATDFFAEPPACTGTPSPVVYKGKWGFAGEDGKTCVRPLWDEVLDFRGGKAPVRLGTRWHLIDQRGRLLAADVSRDEIRILRKAR